jgi:hypothetical protein
MSSAPPGKMGPAPGRPSALANDLDSDGLEGAADSALHPSHSRAYTEQGEHWPISFAPTSVTYDEPVRSQAFVTGRMLDNDADAELQCIVEAAASGTGYPAAAISLVLRHTQVFRAHVGLPAELNASRTIERSLFFCRFVVESDAPYFVNDTELDPNIPREPQERFGFRAYVGLPLRMQGKVIGTLCVLDTKPRSISEADLEKLERLAVLAGRRLAELSGKAPTPGHLISHAAEPAFAEIRNLLSSIVANAAFGRMVVAELDPLFERLADASRGHLSPPDLDRALAEVPHALEAHRELTVAFAELDVVSKKLIDTVGGLEKTVAARTSYAQSIAETVEAATLAAHHFTKLIGGVRWAPLPPAAAQKPAPAWTGLVVSIALQELAARIGPSNQDGIDGSIEVSGASLLIILGAPRLTEVECREIVGDLSFLLNGVSLLDVTAEGSTIRLKL